MCLILHCISQSINVTSSASLCLIEKGTDRLFEYVEGYED